MRRCARNEFFTQDRLRAVICANAGRTAAEIASAINEALDAFLKVRAIQDDVTMVVVRLGAGRGAGGA